MATVYVLCPDENSTVGGIMKLYDLVDCLNNNHIRSFIIHEDLNFRANWFNNSTRITDYKSVNIEQDDLIIIPEIWIEKIMTVWPGIRKIIFNQNSFYTMMPFFNDLEKTRDLYLHEDVVQVLVVSANDYNILNWLFPPIKMTRIFCGINKEIFHFNPNKQKLIAVAPRKAWEEFLFVSSLLRAKNGLDDFTILVIDKISHEECAAILQEAAIFLSFSCNEGFGLPPAEAMACGCIVIGYHGEGGKEYFREDLTIGVEQSNLIDFATQIMNVIEQFNVDPLKMYRKGKKASEFILENYSVARQERSIIEAITPFI